MCSEEMVKVWWTNVLGITMMTWVHSRDNLYQAFLSLILFLGKGSRGRPVDEAS